MNVIVVGAAQHVRRVRHRYLVHLSDYVGYVYFCLLADRPILTFRHSQECVLLTVYACLGGHSVRQHW